MSTLIGFALCSSAFIFFLNAYKLNSKVPYEEGFEPMGCEMCIKLNGGCTNKCKNY
jgi:hypothetical protein